MATRTPKTQTKPVTKLQRPATLDHLKAKGRAVEVVQVRLDAEATRLYEKLTSEIEAAQVLGGEPAAELLDARTAAEAEMEEATVEIRLQSIGRKAYDALVEQHKATPEQNIEHRQEQAQELMKQKGLSLDKAMELTADAPYNAETFPIALIAACAVEPELAEEDVQEFWEDWNLNEFLQLWMAAVRVHNTSKVGYWGKASG
jgi:hypothetical protein